MRLSIRTDERDEPPIELGPGEAVLVGRQPSLDDLEPDHGVSPSRLVAVGSASVSANHVLVSHTSSAIEIVDLESRNGTWLELTPNRRAVLDPSPTLRIHLAPGAQTAPELDAPADADWSNEDEFASGVAYAVQAWLDRRTVAARARVEPTRTRLTAANTLGRIPLDARSDLVIDAVHTMDARWLFMLRRVARYVERQVRRYDAERELAAAGLVVASKAMKRAVQQVIEAAERPGRALLILGPSGSGKEGLSRCYHAHTRPAGPFVSRNCAQFQFGKDLVLSELFGAERGAFTGATRTLSGAVEMADGGTLFLDELGELPLDVQSVFLRFLDRGEYVKTGGSTVQTSDVRLVGATNKDLRAAALEGSFRRDLWFRLAAEVVEVPPLSERFEDVAAYLAGRTRHGERTLYETLDPGALDVLRHHTWEGNFRELINFANRLPDVERIDADTCRRALSAGALTVAAAPSTGARRESASSGGGDWARLLSTAAEAFAADRDGAAPSSWEDVKELVEGYVKPVLFAGLSGTLDAERRDDIDLRAAAERLSADRGTATKQLERYLARFASKTDG